PRDRDQVFHLTQGVIPKYASREYILPTLRNFGASIQDPKWLLYKSSFVNAYPQFQFTLTAWTKEVVKFRKAVTDSVLEVALKRLPKSAYDFRHEELLRKLRVRRDQIPIAMAKYYRFIQKIVDIQTSDKNEFVQITDAPNGGLNIRIIKINKEGELTDELMDKTFDPSLTKQVRLYIRNGNDSVSINNTKSPIGLYIIGGADVKAYNVIASKNKIRLYDKANGSHFMGIVSKLKKRISNDSLHTAYTPVNLYNIRIPLTRIGLNLDDGFILGMGFRFIRQGGFRKSPYRSMHEILVSHSFSTQAYSIKYKSEWIAALGKADIILQATANAPNNTVNFFGRGNETVFNRTGDFKTFYRARFSTYQVNPSLRWHNKKKTTSISIGPSLYYYAFDADENLGRFINNVSQIGSYDSAIVDKNKFHVGATLNFINDKRNNKVFPQHGHMIIVEMAGYKGTGQYAASYGQLISEVSFYKGLNKKSTIILADRVGGQVSVGRPAFYQSAFIGGHENLLGYRQFRFAGHHSLYNNFEVRMKVADIASYIIPGQFGITGFWDVGRVWEKHDNSGKWHNGTGAGIYFAPASIIILSFVVGHSTEGWYPYFTMGLRF
ncbi:MAG: BamA/TamA family outer membrane protein, partial [Chitinophagaceae bacterium]